MKNQFWTDYPMCDLCDKNYEPAPIREIKIIEYDGSLYCLIKVVGTKYIQWIKSGYIYKEPGRHNEVPNLTPKEICRFIRE